VRRALLATATFLLAACSTAAPCGSGFDLRDLDNDIVPQSVIDQVFDSGAIISRKEADFPSGKLVVIRTAFKDWPENPAATKSYIESIFFDDPPNGKTIHGYYRVNSWGQFEVTSGGIPAWVDLPKKLSGYDPGIEASVPFMRDVLEKADVNWKSLDENDDHVISRAEAQIVVLPSNAMPGSGFASRRDVDIGGVQTPNGTFDFGSRGIVYYSLKAKDDPNHAIDPIRNLPGVAHELGHAFFNLPDRYNANGSGTGNYDIMTTSYTWVLLTMFDRMKIGWIKPVIRVNHRSKCFDFLDSEAHKAALVLVPPEMMRAPTGVLEFWVVEYRNKQFGDGYDDDLPDSGLAVWYAATGTYPGGEDDVRLVKADENDKDPDKYVDPISGALFRKSSRNPRRLLLDREGHWSLLWFQRVSDVGGAHMYAEL
jgi:M6 family metalloprotease-like protein